MEKDLTKKTIRSTAIQTIMTVSNALLMLITFSVMSRLLSKEDFGYYAVLTAVTSIFSVFTEAGMGSAVIQRKNFDNKYFNTAFNLALYFGIFFSILLVLLSKPISYLVHESTIVKPLCLMSVTILFYSLNSVLQSAMTRELAFMKIGIFNMSAYALASIISITAAYYGAGVYAVILQGLLTSVFTFSIYYANIYIKPKWFEVDIKHVRSILSYGGWLTASCLFRAIYQQMDKLLMSVWIPISQLGAYNRPSGFISQVSSQLNGIFDTVLFPILSSIQDSPEKIRVAYRKLLYMINIYSGILCTLFVFANKAILILFFGEEWTSLGLVFIVLSFTLLLSVNGRIMDCFIRSLAYVKMGFYMRIAACGITFGCLWLGKDYGLLGLSIAVVISNYAIIAMKMIYIAYKIQYPLIDILLTILNAQKIIVLPLAVFILAYKYINSGFISSFVASCLCAVYFIAILLCVKGIMGDDLSNLLYKRFPKLKKLIVI